jgi:Xaa-Pro aminopeptidase
MLLNKSRAYEIMDHYGLDALVAQLPIDIYYLTDYWGAMSTAGWEYLNFAVLPRQEEAPAALIAPAPEIFGISVEGTWVPNIIVYLAPAPTEGSAAGEEPAALPFPGLPVREGSNLSAIERRWTDFSDRYGPRTAASSLWALARALRDAGVEPGRVGLDNPGVSTWMEETNLRGVEFVPARYAFHEIRMIKSEDEIELLRQAGQINETCLTIAAQAICDGALHREVESIYMMEMARRGAQGVYIVSGLGGLPQGRYVKGEPTMLDALGRYRRYHGDIGRTVHIGSPAKEIQARMQALQAGWLEALDIMRPGLSFADLAGKVKDVVHRAGFTEFGMPTPHNVGLQHTDDPSPVGWPPGIKPDKPLEKNMVINVDMPHIELGWGSVHVEDTVRITADGCEPLTSMDLELIVIDG